MTDALNWYGEDVATFGDRLEAARRNANLSQRELAKHIGIKNSTLQNWEDDVTEPRANKLNTLAGMLEPPHFYWSMFMFRNRRTTNGKQASEAGGYYHKVAAS